MAKEIYNFLHGLYPSIGENIFKIRVNMNNIKNFSYFTLLAKNCEIWN